MRSLSFMLASTVLVVGATLVAANGALTGQSQALFTDQASVGGNTFTTAACFVPIITRAGSWTTGLTHAAGAGSNRVLVFAVSYEHSADPGVTTVSYGGSALTRIAGTFAFSASTYGRAELWYLNEAGIAAAATSTFSVTWGGAAPSLPMYAAATYANVNQTTPIAASSTNFTNSSTPNPITTSVSVTAGAMAVAVVMAGNSGSYTWNNGWTEGTDQTAGATTNSSTAERCAATAATDTASATHSGPNRQAIVAAVLSP